MLSPDRVLIGVMVRRTSDNPLLQGNNHAIIEAAKTFRSHGYTIHVRRTFGGSRAIRVSPPE